MSSHYMSGGVFLSGDNTGSMERIEDLEVDLTDLETSVASISIQQTTNTSNIGSVTAGVTANTQVISGLNAQQTLNTTAIGTPSGPGMLYNINQNDIGIQFIQTDVATNTSNISAVSTKANNNQYVISQLDTVFVEKNGSIPQVLTGQLNVVGTASTTGNLDVGVGQAQTSIKTYVNHAGSTGHLEMEARYRDQGFIHFKTNHTGGLLLFAVKDSLRDKVYMYCGNDIVYIYEDTTINGDLDVGVSQAQSSIKSHLNHAGNTGYMMMEGRFNDQGYLHFQTNYNYGEMFLTVNSTFFIRCSTYAGNPYVQTFQPLTQSSDDRLKENEELIENACDTLSKLRPQLYDRKPDMENDDPTSWYKESGLIAQEIYYDAPELRHLVRRGKPDLDEEGNEIMTSIDPQQDPDYSSWGKDPASVNYIGLIAYLIKANNELNDRVKALEM